MSFARWEQQWFCLHFPHSLDPLRTFTTTELRIQSKVENRSQTPLWRFPHIKLLQKGQSMQELCHSFPVCWQSWNVTKAEMLNRVPRVEAVGTEVMLMLCLCLTFKQLCYSSSIRGEISCSPGTVSSSHCYGWQLQITNPFFFHFISYTVLSSN